MASMDCAKFDHHLLDALYDELDEVTHAAMKRHMESCAKCASTYAELRATREVAAIALEQPSEGFEARVLEAVEAKPPPVAWSRKLWRGLAWAGSHTMRPQLAMAAVAVLVIGSSVLLLRPKPGASGSAPVS